MALDGVIRGGGRARVVRRVASLYSGSITAATPCALPTALATAASSAQLAHRSACRQQPRRHHPHGPPARLVHGLPHRAHRPAASAAVYALYDAPTHSFTPGAERRVPRLSAVAGTSSSTFRRALASFAPYVSQSTRVHRHSPLITCFGVHAVHSLGSARSASGGAALPLPPTHALPPRPPSEARWRSCGSLRVPSPLRSD